jgi:hypothetical protein
VSTHTLTVPASTSLLTGVLEMTGDANLDLQVLSPSGAVLAASQTANPTELTRVDPSTPGIYTFVVRNPSPLPAEYRLSMVRTDPGGGSMAGALPEDVHAQHGTAGSFDPSGAIAYTTASGGPVLIRVFSVQGKLIRTLNDQVPAAGRHVTRWNGRSGDGAKLASGVYLYRIQHPNGDISTVKTLLLR